MNTSIAAASNVTLPVGAILDLERRLAAATTAAVLLGAAFDDLKDLVDDMTAASCEAATATWNCETVEAVRAVQDGHLAAMNGMRAEVGAISKRRDEAEVA